MLSSADLSALAACIIRFALACTCYQHKILATADVSDATAKARRALASPDHALHNSPRPRPVSIQQEDLKLGPILGKGSFAVVGTTIACLKHQSAT